MTSRVSENQFEGHTAIMISGERNDAGFPTDSGSLAAILPLEGTIKRLAGDFVWKLYPPDYAAQLQRHLSVADFIEVDCRFVAVWGFSVVLGMELELDPAWELHCRELCTLGDPVPEQSNALVPPWFLIADCQH